MIIETQTSNNEFQHKTENSTNVALGNDKIDKNGNNDKNSNSASASNVAGQSESSMGRIAKENLTKEEDQNKQINTETTTDNKISSPEKEIEALKTELEKSKQIINELKNQYLRSLADYDNLRKRTNKEVLEASDRGKEDLIKKLLPVIDSFQNAIKLLHDAKVDKKIVDGIEMLWFQFSDVLEKEGLKAIPALNQKFDPNFHEAIMKSSDPNKDDEIIVKEFEVGYTFKNRVIRTSKVEINSK